MYTGYIYKITNKVNGKSYIGKTNNLNRRWNEHKSGKGGTAILSRAFTKYGNPVEIFNSATEASKITLIGRKAIVNCLTKRSKSAGGYLWIYKDGGSI